MESLYIWLSIYTNNEIICIIWKFDLRSRGFLGRIYALSIEVLLKAILYRFEYTTPVLSLWYSRCSDMQRHRAILHLFEYTTPVLSLWYIWCSNTQWHRRYCTFWIDNTSFVLVIYQMQQYATFQIFNAGFSFKRGIRFTNWGLNYFKLVFENSIAFFWPFAN